MLLEPYGGAASWGVESSHASVLVTDYLKHSKGFNVAGEERERETDPFWLFALSPFPWKSEKLWPMIL